jgi:hypothetical protein
MRENREAHTTRREQPTTPAWPATARQPHAAHRLRPWKLGIPAILIGGVLGGVLLLQAVPGAGARQYAGSSSHRHGKATATPRATISPTHAPTATATTAPTATPAPSPTTPPAGGNPPAAPKGGATAPGAILPTEAACAAAIPSSTWEPRPDNATANHSVPTASQIAALAPWDGSIGLDPRADALRKQITGHYTGTTDQILQWTACKWGIDPNIVRAQAVQESYWHESTHGDLTSTTADCPPGAATSGSSCYQSYGILQIKWIYNKSAWPMSRDDTAFSAEYAYGMIRTCYEGYMTWLGNGYKAGDIWGCLGYWFSGDWYTSGAQNYIASVKSHYNNQDWLAPGF